VLSHDKERTKPIVLDYPRSLQAIKDNLRGIVQIRSIRLKVYLDPNLKGNIYNFVLAFILFDLPLKAYLVALKLNGFKEAIICDSVAVRFAWNLA
jgi:hypothetical protein